MNKKKKKKIIIQKKMKYNKTKKIQKLKRKKISLKMTMLKVIKRICDKIEEILC